MSYQEKGLICILRDIQLSKDSHFSVLNISIVIM